MSGPRLGVGVLGAGPVTQAIHLPTLARLADRFHVAVVMDVDATSAERVARRADARWTTSQEELLADPDVDVVLIASPPQFHAGQVEAACAAGVRAVLCEKPFATSQEEALRVAAAAARSGVPVVVGAMHAHDPAWLAARRAWEEVTAATGEQVVAVRSCISLPPNSRFEDYATQITHRPTPAAPDLGDPQAVADLLRNLVLGLTVHDLPLLRTLVPHVDRVTEASLLAPLGSHVSLQAPGCTVDLTAVLHQHWQLEWTLQAWTAHHALEVVFTPSYVHAGSAVGVVRGPEGTRVFGPFDHNGYEGEWRHLHEVATGAADLLHDTATVVADLAYTVDIADRVAAASLDPSPRRRRAEVAP